MKQIQTCLFSLLLFTTVVVTSLFPCDAVADTCDQWVAQVVSVQGSVQARRVDEPNWQPVRLNDTYCPGDMIRVLERSRAAILLINETILRLDQNSAIIFNGVEKEKTSLIDLLKGAAHFFSRFPRSLKVFTPFVNGTVEGTEFLVRVEKDHTFISLFEGQVSATNEAGSLTLSSGQSAVAEAGKAPVVRVVVRPRDAVQWALYYPPVIYKYPEELKDTDPRFYTLRASSLLSVGRVNEARADIERALSIDPKNSDAFALESVIAVAQNEKEKALSFANRAVEADPKSASALIALSYAQ
ncbi:MAG: FecR domain-containing protein, partial [Nitrospirota bacterium]|nr:FecR domain-containing protein [Nitrospirota bacterium]